MVDRKRNCRSGRAGTWSVMPRRARVVMGVMLALLAPVALAQSRPATEAEVERLREALDNRLKDPGSAQLRDVAILDSPGMQWACGQVNAKNSFGGYVGYTAFVGALIDGSETTHGKPTAIVIGVDRPGEGHVAQMCLDKGF